MTYITLPEIKSYLTINSDTNDANLALLANYACAVVESYIGQKLQATNYVEFHNGGRSSIFTDRVPINNVAEVAEYDGIQYVPLIPPNPDGSLINTSANANVIQFVWHTDSGQISRDVGRLSGDTKLNLIKPLSFQNFAKGIRVTYNGGYTVIPGDLKLATLDYIKLLHKQDTAKSVSFQGQSIAAETLSANFPPHIRRILDLHRILR